MRWAACIEYDGTAYHGWQSQSHVANVQDTLEHALSTVADAPIRVVASGRTDAGVHAEAQVVHFDTQVQRRQRAWLLGANRYLPQDVAVLWVVPVQGGLHAPRSAVDQPDRFP